MSDQKFFDEMCPILMSMGQSCEEFWYGDPWLSRYYIKASQLKTEHENELAWLQGMYVYDAFAVVLANAFSKKGAKKLQYMEKPVRLTPMTEEEKKAEQRKKLLEMTESLKRLRATNK